MVLVVLAVVLVIIVAAFSVSPLTGFVLLGLLVAGIYKLVQTDDSAATTPQQNHSPATNLANSKKDHEPPRPHSTLTDPWSTRTARFEVAGEFYRSSNISRLFRGLSTSQDGGAELHLPAVLVPDPRNPYDKNAVAVFVDGEHVGYLARADAKTYASTLAKLSIEGQSLRVESRQWARYDAYRKDLYSRVTLRIPDRGSLLPKNALPNNSVVLPAGSTIQVTKEDAHMEAIAPWLDPRGAEVPLALTLHAIVDIRPRSAVDAVQVQLDGQPVGILSPASTANLLPLVKYVSERDKTPVARGILKGNAIKADVTLFVAKAHDVDPQWIEELGPIISPEQAMIRHPFEWDDEPETPAP